MAASQIRQNFHNDSENGINKQINMELYASYIYLSMSYYFDRDDVALKGISHFFKNASDEEREHATKLMTYLNKRGGKINLYDIRDPSQQQWENAEEAMGSALQLEKYVNQRLLNLHEVGTTHNDANLWDFLESEYLQEQVDAIKELGDNLSNIRRVGSGFGIFMFDKELDKSS